MKKPTPDLKCGSTRLYPSQLCVTCPFSCEDCDSDGPQPQDIPIPTHAEMLLTEAWNTRPRAPRKGAPVKEEPNHGLKPCPFCGSTRLYASQLCVTCEDCDSDGPQPQDIPIPIHAEMSLTEAWNTRPRAPRKGAPVKEEPKHGLKPCPFCAETDLHVSSIHVQCKTCGAGGPCPPASPTKEWFAEPRWSPKRVSPVQVDRTKKLRAYGKAATASEFAGLIELNLRPDMMGPAGARVLTDLRRYGLVNREKRGDKNGRKRWVYFVSPDGQRAIEAALTVRRKGRTP